MLIMGAAAQNLRHRDYAAPPLHPRRFGTESVRTPGRRVPLGSKNPTGVTGFDVERTSRFAALDASIGRIPPLQASPGKGPLPAK